MVMEGNGPANGELRRAGYLVGGRDALACELVCARLLGIPPADLPLVQAFRRRGLAIPEPEMVGDRVVALADFRRPAGFDVIRFLSHPLMGWLRRFLGGRFRLLPVIDSAVCRRCGRCREVCPGAAISGEFMVIRARCVRCLCCFEVCPHRAVKLKKSFVARFFGP
jgi:ferredoxin